MAPPTGTRNTAAEYYARSIVVQPTTFCNINCKYCYIPNRQNQDRMTPPVVDRLAREIQKVNRPVSLIWHGGEPLSSGIKHFESLLGSFDCCEQLVRHHLQTNGTLVTESWCDLLKRYRFQIGVSIDGPQSLNINRVDWKNAETFERTVKGMRLLQKQDLKFSIIAVVTEASLSQASSLYKFAVESGCALLGINVEEFEGPNLHRPPDDDRITRFWEELLDAWSANPIVPIREFTNVIAWMLNPREDRFSKLDLLPSVGFNGDVVLLSPEFLGARAPEYDNFVIGNILNESLSSMLGRAHDIPYVRQYVEGIRKCRMTCDFFSCCGGGQASNKYFELHRIDGTETTFCRNSKQRLAMAVLNRC